MSEAGDDRRTTDEAEEEYFGPRFLARLHARLHRNPVTGLATKAVVTLVGAVVLLAGVVMMVTPGPGIVGIALGLAILSTEWRWADRLLDSARASAKAAAEKARDLDPAVRRRRILATLLALVAALLLASAALSVWGWPNLALDGWDWLQGLVPALPELPYGDL